MWIKVDGDILEVRRLLDHLGNSGKIRGAVGRFNVLGQSGALGPAVCPAPAPGPPAGLPPEACPGCVEGRTPRIPVAKFQLSDRSWYQAAFLRD